ncbi:hypothetical protein LEMLEM_LOCUS20930 [Lemmus lemmus]
MCRYVFCVYMCRFVCICVGMCVFCVYMCRYVHMNAGAHGGQKKALDRLVTGGCELPPNGQGTELALLSHLSSLLFYSLRWDLT